MVTGRMLDGNNKRWYGVGGGVTEASPPCDSLPALFIILPVIPTKILAISFFPFPDELQHTE